MCSWQRVWCFELDWSHLKDDRSFKVGWVRLCFQGTVEVELGFILLVWCIEDFACVCCAPLRFASVIAL